MHDENLAICAGICISLGCMAFLMASVKIVGAILFAVGLLAVVTHGFQLFTGTICTTCYSVDRDGIFNYYDFDAKVWIVKDQLWILLYNILGAAIAAFLFVGCEIQTPVQEIVAAKLSAPLFAVFCKAIFCNVLICLAVDEWKRQKNSLMVIFGVAVFVFCGFEHCIANAFYMMAANNFSIPFFVVNVIGNAVGGIVFWRMSHFRKGKYLLEKRFSETKK